MEQAFQNYERATQEANTELRAVWKAEREELSRERRKLKELETRLELEATEGRRALAADRAALAAEIAGVEGMVTGPADQVLLNVGGRHYTTTRGTLTAARTLAPASLLGAMFSGRHEGRQRPDGEGRVFFNRNGALFEYILGFLRGVSAGDAQAAFEIHALPKTQMRVMREELKYYGLESAVFPLVHFCIDLATFSPGPEMLSSRRGFGAVVLPENRGVLVAGGAAGRGNYLASTELLNLTSQLFSPAPLMRSRRDGCAAAVLGDGKVVVVGGYNEAILATTEILRPASEHWTHGPNLATGRSGCAALTVNNSSILIIGGTCGSNSTSSLSSTEIIDLATGASTPGPHMNCPRSYCSAVRMDDGRVLVIGGKNRNTRILSTTEILDLTSGTSTPGPEMDTARCRAAATLLPTDGKVLVIGGIGGEQIDGVDLAVTLASTEVLDVARNTTSPGPELGIPRSYCAAVELPGDRILVVGGLSNGTTVSTSEILGM